MIAALLRTAAVRRLLPVLVLLAGTTWTAQAGVNFTLTPSPAITQGTTAVLSGAVSNSGPDPVFLNGVSFQFLSAPAGAITNPGDPNVALSLYFDPGAPFTVAGTTDPTTPIVYTGALFDILTAPGAALGDYDVRVTLQGGADGAASNSLGFVDFTQKVSPPVSAPVPELSTALGFGLPAMLMACRMLHRRRSCPQS